MKEITQKTLLPISIVLLLLAAAVHITNIDALSSANAQNINELKKMIINNLTDIQKRLSRIEGLLERR